MIASANHAYAINTLDRHYIEKCKKVSLILYNAIFSYPQNPQKHPQKHKQMVHYNSNMV